MKTGKYIYCVINKGIEKMFGNKKVGIGDNKVYSVPYKEISAVVHDCSVEEIEKLKKIKDEEKIMELVIAHEYVIYLVKKSINTLIPFNMGVVIKGNEKKLKGWLQKKYKLFKNDLEKNKGKEEFAVQVFHEGVIQKESKEKNLKQGVKAYILKQRQLRKELITKLAGYKKDFYGQINSCVEAVKVNKSKKPMLEKFRNKQMIMNLNCFVHKDKVKELKDKLKKIGSTKGFSVCFGGPWIPFSFIGYDEIPR